MSRQTSSNTVSYRHLVLTIPLYHVPELAIWVLCPLLFVCVTVTIYVLNKSLTSPGKRGVKGSFMNFCLLWPIIGHSLTWEAEAKPCPCTALLMCSESGVLGKPSGHPGKTVGGSRVPPPATITCALATSLATAKREKRDQEPGELFCWLFMAIGSRLSSLSWAGQLLLSNT